MHPVDLIRGSSMTGTQKFNRRASCHNKSSRQKQKHMNNSFDIYEMVNNLIIERLESGIIPWRMPWKTGIGFPRNLVSKRAYTGFNFFYLLSLQFSSPWFLTWKQIQDLGGKVVKGSKSSRVVFWKILEFDDSGSKTEIPYLQYYNVFNLTQTEGIDPKHIPDDESFDRDFNPIAAAERLIYEWKDCPAITWDDTRAFYAPLEDKVYMPPQRTFISEELCYSVLYHELVHSTGHLSRLGRDEKIKDHQSKFTNYSQEELVAEMGAAYLCGITGIEQQTIQNSAAYIKSWIRTFKDDPKVLVLAAAQAQNAVNYMINQHHEIIVSEASLC
jgi:antirestriction protein ArdC